VVTKRALGLSPDDLLYVLTFNIIVLFRKDKGNNTIAKKYCQVPCNGLLVGLYGGYLPLLQKGDFGKPQNSCRRGGFSSLLLVMLEAAVGG
jgi:hypothetical protein